MLARGDSAGGTGTRQLHPDLARGTMSGFLDQGMAGFGGPCAGMMAGHPAINSAGMMVGQLAINGAGMMVGQPAINGAGMMAGPPAINGAGMIAGQHDISGTGMMVGQPAINGAGMTAGHPPISGAGMMQLAMNGVGITAGHHAINGAGIMAGHRAIDGASMLAGPRGQGVAGLDGHGSGGFVEGHRVDVCAAQQGEAPAAGQPPGTVPEKLVPFVLGIVLTEESQLTSNGFPHDAPAITYDKNMNETFNIANAILPQLVDNLLADVVLNHDQDWQNYPEVGRAVVTAGGEENGFCVGICAPRGRWAVGLGGGWKTREASAKLALCVVLAQEHPNYERICQRFPEFGKLCRGECSPSAIPASKRAPEPVATPTFGAAPVTRWVTLAEPSTVTAEGYPPEAPAVMHSKEFGALFNASHAMLTELVGNVAGHVKLTHDPDWTLFPEIARAAKAAGCEETCICIATCPDHSVWAVGLGAGWRTREAAAKVALCVALTRTPSPRAPTSGPPASHLLPAVRGRLCPGGPARRHRHRGPGGLNGAAAPAAAAERAVGLTAVRGRAYWLIWVCEDLRCSFSQPSCGVGSSF
ncbi:unnamed protein product [Prorocentrum cordatum]|uniref:Profilin n=1 Tax=Prorocentrum cordatum TaxID=2364126 RepID=A0ABN9SRS0_9DINO|nr:unnamed protein product [Polarella glacialis]